VPKRFILTDVASYNYNEPSKLNGKGCHVRGKYEEAMGEVLGAGRSVQAAEVEVPAMAAEVERETR
jgi:hypothetical protein